MNPHFRFRGGTSKFKSFTHYTKQKLPDELSSSRTNQYINYNDTSNYNLLFLAVHDDELELTHSLIKEFSLHLQISGRKIIHIAAARGHKEIVCLLRRKGAEIMKGDIAGNTPLHLAVKGNHTDVVNLLLTDPTANLQNLKRETPLHIATQMSNSHFVNLLLKNGAKVDLQDADGKTPLHIATGKINPNLKIVTSLLTHGASVQASCKNGFTPLHCVTTSGNVKITEILIDHGASLSVKNKKNMDPLCLAIQENKTEMAKYIFGKKTEVDLITIGNMMPLHFAAQTGNEEIVKMLVTGGDANMINASGEQLKTPLYFSVANGHTNVVKYLIESGALTDVTATGLNTPLHISAAAGYWEIVNELLNGGAKVDCFNSERLTPLYLAVRAGHKKVVSLLVNKGASLDSRKIAFSDEDVLPAFHVAAKSGDEEIMEIFLKNGIEVDLRSKNEKTALHITATFGYTKLVEELVKAGADINARTKFLETPLHLSAASGRSDTVKYLLSSGADVQVTANKGYTPLHYALDRERHEGLRNPQKNNKRRIICYRSRTVVDILPKQVIISSYCFEKYLKITEMLLIKGASMEAETHEGKNPFDYAFKIKVSKENQLEYASNSREELNASKRRTENTGKGEFRPEMVRCLLNYGAKVNDSMLIDVIDSKDSECLAMVDVLLEYYVIREPPIHYVLALEMACVQHDCNLVLAIAELIPDVDTFAEFLLSHLSTYGIKITKLLIAIFVKIISTSKTDYSSVLHSKKLELFLENYKADLFPWYTQCELEVINMQEMKIHHQFDLTFYEFLTKPVSELAKYVRSKDLMRVFNSGIAMQFEGYASMLERNIQRGKETRALIDSCTECFFSIIRHSCKIELPSLVVDQIFDYLSVIDLRKLSATITKKSHNYKRPSYAQCFRYNKRKKY